MGSLMHFPEVVSEMFEIAHFEFISTFGGYIPEERVITIVILSRANDVQKVYFRFANYSTSPN